MPKEQCNSVVILCHVYLSNTLLSAIYYSVDKIEKNEMGGACNMYSERRGVYRVFVGKPEGKSKLGRPRFRWEDNINL